MDKDRKTASHLTDITSSIKTSTTTPPTMMSSYNSPVTATGAPAGPALGWFSTTQCAASRYRSLLLPTSEYHLPVPANCHMNGRNSIFTARCTLVQSAVLRSHVVCPSVCLSVTLVDQDDIGRKSWKLIARTFSPTPSLFGAQRPKVIHLLPG